MFRYFASGSMKMEITTLIAAVAAFGLPCSNPELREFPAEQMPWPAAYIRSIEGQNIIALREGTRDDTQHLPKILVHELLHCGLFEDRERRGQPQPHSLDAREEMAVQAMTDVVLKRLNAAAATEPLDLSQPKRLAGESRRVRDLAEDQKGTDSSVTGNMIEPESGWLGRRVLLAS